jgi:hypothetical protein
VSTMVNPMEAMIKEAMGDAIADIVRTVIQEEVRTIIREEMNPLIDLATKADAAMEQVATVFERTRTSNGFLGKMLRSAMDD